MKNIQSLYLILPPPKPWPIPQLSFLSLSPSPHHLPRAARPLTVNMQAFDFLTGRRGGHTTSLDVQLPLAIQFLFATIKDI